ncbi:MAG TPA: tRNA (guanosine(37)-N1)-methyltransferase TrmD [Polyangia bacterium]
MSEPSPPFCASPLLDVEMLSLFPEIFDSFLRTSLVGKAIEGGIVRVVCTNPRDFARGRHRQVDDASYGGGPGMVLRPEPLAAAIESVEAARGRAHRVLLSPAGRLFDQALAQELAGRKRLMLICGRYEGVDERIADLFADEVISIGDYVLAGGEVAATVIVEAVARLIPGVLGCEASTIDESFSAGRLEYPQWTRPPEFRGLGVPEILLSGNHAQVAAWRRLESMRRTQARRPDLLLGHPLTEDEQALLAGGTSKRRKKPAPQR